jgi:Trk K+ transport system NAD-binding subunit
MAETKLEEVNKGSTGSNMIEYSNLAEVILTPHSRLINKTIQESAYRENYGLTVLSIQRANLETEKRVSWSVRIGRTHTDLSRACTRL